MPRKRHPRAATAIPIPEPFRLPPSITGLDRDRATAIETMLARLGSRSSVPIIHRDRSGDRFTLVIRRTDPTADPIGVARLAASAPRFGLSLIDEVIQANTWTLTVQAIGTGDAVRDSFDAFTSHAILLGLAIANQLPEPAPEHPRNEGNNENQ